MVERGEHLRLAFETRQTLRISGEYLREDLQRNVSSEPRVAGAIYLAHSARTERAADFIETDPLTCRESHLVGSLQILPRNAEPAHSNMEPNSEHEPGSENREV